MVKSAIFTLTAGLSLSAAAWAQQAPGDFSGQRADGFISTSYYGCYASGNSAVQAPLADGSCPPNTFYGTGNVNSPSTQRVSVTQLTSYVASQLEITGTPGSGPGPNNTYISYGVSVPISDFATSTSVSALQSQVSTLATTSSVASEATRATSAESQLGTTLSNETTRATSAETQLGTNIANETSRATSAEAHLGTSISNETSRAEGVETQLGASIAVETSRAMTVETNLSQLITNETTAREADIARVSWQFRSATASAVALSGNGFVPGKRFNLTINYGAYQGESSVAVQGAYVVSPNAYINFGVASGLSGGSTAYRTGVTMGW